MVAFFFKPRSI